MFYKLGKLSPRKDKRTFLFSEIANTVTVPDSYDFDVGCTSKIPTPLFANNRFRICVLAARAHQTYRFEYIEQEEVIEITDKDVMSEYFNESGGKDRGLSILSSLKLWRNGGWKVGKRKYKIQAFSKIDPFDRIRIKQAIHIDVGIILGLALPKSAETQLEKVKPWEIVKGNSGATNSWGRHCVYANSYDKFGIGFITHGIKLHMSWAFLEKYCDEAYVAVDAINTEKKKYGIAFNTLRRMLRSIKQ